MNMNEREAVTAFRGALVAGLPAVAARLEESAARYDRAELANAREIDRTAGGLGDRPGTCGRLGPGGWPGPAGWPGAGRGSGR